MSYLKFNELDALMQRAIVIANFISEDKSESAIINLRDKLYKDMVEKAFNNKKQ